MERDERCSVRMLVRSEQARLRLDIFNCSGGPSQSRTSPQEGSMEGSIYKLDACPTESSTTAPPCLLDNRVTRHVFYRYTPFILALDSSSSDRSARQAYQGIATMSTKTATAELSDSSTPPYEHDLTIFLPHESVEVPAPDILYPFITQPSYAQVLNLRKVSRPRPPAFSHPDPFSAYPSFRLPAQRPSSDQQIMTAQMSLYVQCNQSLAAVLEEARHAPDGACRQLTALLFPEGRVVSGGAPSLGGEASVQRQESIICSSSCLTHLHGRLSQAASTCSAAWNSCPRQCFSPVPPLPASETPTADSNGSKAVPVVWWEPTLTGKRILEKLVFVADILYALDTRCAKGESGGDCTVGLADLVNSSSREQAEVGS